MYPWLKVKESRSKLTCLIQKEGLFDMVLKGVLLSQEELTEIYSMSEIKGRVYLETGTNNSVRNNYVFI